MHPSETHKAPTPMNECKPIKLGGPAVAAQGKAVVTGGKQGKGKKGTQKYPPNYEWDALSAVGKPKPMESWKEGSLDKSDKSAPSAKTANTIKSLLKTTTKLNKLVYTL